MTTYRTLRARGSLAAVMAAAAVLLAACGSSSSTHTTSAAASSAASTIASTAGAPSLTIGTATGSAGTYLVGASGRALYIWAADVNGKSACSGACAQGWPPVIATTPKHAGGVQAADLSTVARADGSKQVTYHGHPLYYFAGDSGPGMTNGEGSDGFGAKWWLISPTGHQLTGGSSAASSSSSSGGGYGSGY